MILMRDTFKISISPEEIEALPLGTFPGKIQVIDNCGFKFMKAVNYLKQQKILGFDTETRPCFEHRQPHNGVALLQLSGADRAYLFRIQKTGLKKGLREVLADPDIIKVGAASHDDVRSLQRVSHFEEKGFVDLQKIVPEYHFTCLGLQRIYAILFNERISKSQQLSNWEADTLSDAQQTYAAIDAWACVKIYNRLMSPEFNVEDLTKYIVINQEDDEVEK